MDGWDWIGMEILWVRRFLSYVSRKCQQNETIRKYLESVENIENYCLGKVDSIHGQCGTYALVDFTFHYKQ